MCVSGRAASRPGTSRNCRVRSEVEENLVARQHARAAVIQVHLERLRRHEAPAPHDQFGAARLVVLQMQGDLALRPCRACAGGPSPCRSSTGPADRAELRRVVRQMRDPRAPDLVLAGQAGDVGAGAADPAALDDGGPPPRPRQMPGQQLAALAAAKDQDFKLFGCRHELSPSLFLVMGECLRDVRAPVDFGWTD